MPRFPRLGLRNLSRSRCQFRENCSSHVASRSKIVCVETLIYFHPPCRVYRATTVGQLEAWVLVAVNRPSTQLPFRNPFSK